MKTFIAVTYFGEKITMRNCLDKAQALAILADGKVLEDDIFSLEEV